MDLNEHQTRKQKIDVLLREQGWDVDNRSHVIQEVDTKQSDFNACDYKTVDEMLKNDLEGKYADRCLRPQSTWRIVCHPFYRGTSYEPVHFPVRRAALLYA